MPSDASQVDRGCPATTEPKRSKCRLLSLADLDRRTAAYKHASDLVASIEGDLGGSDRLTAGERQIVQRAAVTGALIEDLEARWLKGEPIDVGQYCTLTNAQRRLLETVGLQRRPRDVTPSLSEYLTRRCENSGVGDPNASAAPKQRETENALCDQSGAADGVVA